MARKPKKQIPPACTHCSAPAQLVDGAAVYPHRPDLVTRKFWRCGHCGAYVGCHKGTDRPLGTPANTQLRDARIKLHNLMVDPLWENAVSSVGYRPEDARAVAIIRNTARARVYAFLAWKLGIDKEDCHVAMFTLEQCRAAWVALRGRTYPEIRDWAKARKAAEKAKEAA